MGCTETLFMEVCAPRNLGVGHIDVERIPIGTAGDYKPCVAQLADGTLLVSAYRTAPALHGTAWADYHDWTVGSPQRRYLETPTQCGAPGTGERIGIFSTTPKSKASLTGTCGPLSARASCGRRVRGRSTASCASTAGGGWPDIEDKPLGVARDQLNDQSDRMILFATEDLGRTWSKVRDFGAYGQMYPSILRLADGRLLLTFTQRANAASLGLRATIGVEHDDGFEFDLESDLIMIDTKTPEGMPSGGGFGCTVQLDDGALVSSYSYRTETDEFAGLYAQINCEIARWRLP